MTLTSFTVAVLAGLGASSIVDRIRDFFRRRDGVLCARCGKPL